MTDGCFQEVARLHRFFQQWFRGEVIDMSTCEETLADDFSLVTPQGELLSREEILHAIREHHGREGSDFTIETVGRKCDRLGAVHPVTYEEHQRGVRSTTRVSTAALTEEAGLFLWHRVHETWLTV